MNDYREITVLCEGQSEREFVSKVLRPHLACHLKPISLKRNNEFGMVSATFLKASIKGAIGNLRDHQYVTTMIDLYAIPKDYISEEAARLKREDKARAIETRLAEEMPNPHWLPYVQLHELEALLFVDLDSLTETLAASNVEESIRKLKSTVEGLSPEEINEDKNSAPSKRILRYVPAYAKGEAAADALARIGLPRLRAVCPHFDAWVSRLEAIATGQV